jgi:lysyl-tRNA synthetase class I
VIVGENVDLYTKEVEEWNTKIAGIEAILKDLYDEFEKVKKSYFDAKEAYETETENNSQELDIIA